MQHREFIPESDQPHSASLADFLDLGIRPTFEIGRLNRQLPQARNAIAPNIFASILPLDAFGWWIRFVQKLCYLLRPFDLVGKNGQYQRFVAHKVVWLSDTNTCPPTHPKRPATAQGRPMKGKVEFYRYRLAQQARKPGQSTGLHPQACPIRSIQWTALAHQHRFPEVEWPFANEAAKDDLQRPRHIE